MCTTLRRRALAVLAGGAVAVSTAVAAAPTASAAPTPSTAAAGQWLSAQLTNGVVHNDQWDYDDFGLTLDVLGALRALDVQPAVQQQILSTVTSRVDEYVESTWEGVTTFYPASAGKLALAVDAAGGDVASVGGRDLVAQIEAATNDETGESSDTYGLFGQTFATRGLIAGGSDEAATSVGYVAAQQCADGTFRQVLTAPCPEVPEIDTTAAALHTLVDAREAGLTVDAAVVDRAVAAIAAAQGADGSFVGNGVPNTNSTGLAAAALSRAGRATEATKAATWVARHQVTEATGGKLAAQAGAIAYDQAALTAGAEDGIDEFAIDQWVRASAQAAPALAVLSSPKASVSVPKFVRSGSALKVSASGLAAGWSSTARVAGGSTARTVVPAAGRATFTVRVPKGTARRAVVVGDSTGRAVASTSVQVLAAKKLRVSSKAKVRRAKVQKVVVRGLVAGEPVRVYYRGKLVKRGVATKTGTYTYRLKVGKRIGKAKVIVRGAYSERNGVRVFRVVK
ncbi:prenyltransferase/squalene oxidase repeat-containing protein [Aeromicrobium choanae]|uniref:Prenyltransferase and squalene oxidase repeat-containing protein n=1 Tax=Aeromicrobium choanae TaxID=1736691 RepID=A0A1T4Z1D7_9ACTN|nr:hypothetical protein [Aeromicrobium choanae]SKB07860.1 hypothetical protein SAMN06295964_1884 [Aeromicrobium choanae]